MPSRRLVQSCKTGQGMLLDQDHCCPAESGLVGTAASTGCTHHVIQDPGPLAVCTEDVASWHTCREQAVVGI